MSSMNLYKFLDSIMRVALEEGEFSHYEEPNSYLAWLTLCPKESITKERIRLHAQIVTERYSKYDEEAGADPTNSSLNFNATKIIADRATLACFHWRLGEKENYKKTLGQLRTLIRVCRSEKLLDKEYLDGFTYVIDAFEMENEMDLDPSQWKILDRYNSFSVKKKAAILSMKSYFIGQLRVNHELQIQTLREMIKMDSDSFEWRLNLFNHLRFIRRNVVKTHGTTTPGDEELELLQRAIQLAPQHPRVLLHFCQILAEFLKTSKNQRNRRAFPFRLCGFRFESAAVTVAYIKKTSEEILSVYGTSVATYVKVAEFFTSMMVREHQDVEFSRQCLQKAMELNPNSTRALHRLGVTFFYFEPKSIPKALEHFRLALEKDPFNFGALMDAIHVLMIEPHKNASEIQEYFQKAIEVEGFDYWGQQKYLDVLFSRGCFYLMLGKRIECVEDWLQVQTLAEDCMDNFKAIKKDIYRYGWSEQYFSIHNVIAAIRFCRGKLEDRAGELNKLEMLARKGITKDGLVRDTKKCASELVESWR